MKILGISAYYHDSASALVEDGVVIAAAQEERFTRRKHDPGFPEQAIEYCLGEANLKLRDLDAIAFYEKPFLTFERLMETYVAFAPRGFTSFRQAAPVWIKDKLFMKQNLVRRLKAIDPECDARAKLVFTEHHQSHAASAFYPSPFEEAVILTMDGVGEWATTSVAIGRGTSIEFHKEIRFPHSLGLLYSAFTQYLGFKVNSGEYKVMGLAPYGAPVHVGTILDNLIELGNDGGFRLNMAYFDYCTGLSMINARFEALFGHPRRASEAAPLEPFHMDIAASVQAALNQIVVMLTDNLAGEFGIPNLCLAGGVALNCVTNGKIRDSGRFKNLWVQPAAGDAGGALGSALAAAYTLEPDRRRSAPSDTSVDHMRGAYLGPGFGADDASRRLTALGAAFQTVDEATLLDETAAALADGMAVGWFQGRMEFGPRALGARSILADPRADDMQRRLNLKVKYRESFRPFAPAVLREDLEEWFDLDIDSPYMLLVESVRNATVTQTAFLDDASARLDQLHAGGSPLPAITHVDNSARIQTVHRETNPRFHALLSRFKERTGCPVLVNTSFNVRGEPIVCTPDDAFKCFMNSELDLLVVENCLLHKDQQPEGLAERHRMIFPAD